MTRHTSCPVAHGDASNGGADQVHDPMIDADRLCRHLSVWKVLVVLGNGPDDGIAQSEGSLGESQKNKT